MATDGPGLMMSDDGSEFCAIAYKTIRNGQLNVDHLLKEYDKRQKEGYRDNSRELNLEEYRFIAELVKVLHRGKVKEELYIKANYDDDGNGVPMYDILDKAVVSRKTLELIYKKSKENYIHMNGIGFEYYDDINYMKKYSKVALGRYNSIQEKEQLDRIIGGLKKLPCNNLEDAKKLRNKLMNIKNKYKILGVCSNQIIDDIDRLLYHGWKEEKDYLIMLNSIKESIIVIKEILDTPKENYVLYTKTK